MPQKQEAAPATTGRGPKLTHTCRLTAPWGGNKAEHYSAIRLTLRAMLDGAAVANAVMPWGKPGPIRLPDDPTERAALVNAHVRGEPADVTYCPAGHAPSMVHVEALALAGFCPAADGRCRWLGIDLDAADGHGAGGLADPEHAAGCLVERADAAGLLSGLLVARSRGGRGRHVFVFPPEPVALADGVLALAALVASAFKIAAADADNYGAPHAFRCADGAIAEPGQAGAMELRPRGTARPALGWTLALPAAGAFAQAGGGTVLDPFTDTPCELSAVPRCDARQWARFVADARAMLPRQRPGKLDSRPVAGRSGVRWASGTGPRALDARTHDFLEGRVSQGTRNSACFAAGCNLLGSGVSESEAERLILAGAVACELPEREARTCFASAAMAAQTKGRR
jgi:hypothetical protein